MFPSWSQIEENVWDQIPSPSFYNKLCGTTTYRINLSPCCNYDHYKTTLWFPKNFQFCNLNIYTIYNSNCTTGVLFYTHLEMHINMTLFFRLPKEWKTSLRETSRQAGFSTWAPSWPSLFKPIQQIHVLTIPKSKEPTNFQKWRAKAFL